MAFTRILWGALSSAGVQRNQYMHIEARAVPSSLTCSLGQAQQSMLGCRVWNNLGRCNIRVTRSHIEDDAHADLTSPSSQIHRGDTLSLHDLRYGLDAVPITLTCHNGSSRLNRPHLQPVLLQSNPSAIAVIVDSSELFHHTTVCTMLLML